MRELVFELDYYPGWNPVSDTLAEHEGASIRSLSCHVTAETLWRVDYITGSPQALTELETAYKTADYFPDCLVTDNCEANSETKVLDRTDDSLIIYCVWNRSEICSSVPHLALEYLGEGLLFETRQQGHQHIWRIVLAGQEDISTFTAALKSEIKEVGGMELLRLTEHMPDREPKPSQENEELPSEQRQALHAAVNHGYYETPRRIELTELADEMDIPQSTLSYRLQRAESHLATQFVDTDISLDSLMTKQ